jgi:hypothetical protein
MLKRIKEKLELINQDKLPVKQLIIDILLLNGIDLKDAINLIDSQKIIYLEQIKKQTKLLKNGKLFD